jgi:hypothetical protein
MIRTAAFALVVLAATDSLMFGGRYTHLVTQIADNFLHFVF